MPTPPDDIMLNKAAVIERCIRRIQEEYSADPALENYTHLDALTLNIERACQGAIDLAMHIIAQKRLGIPQSSGDAFRLLEKGKVISKELQQSLAAMTGFRNIAVHEYQELDKDVIHYIAKDGYRDLIEFVGNLGVRIALKD